MQGMRNNTDSRWRQMRTARREFLKSQARGSKGLQHVLHRQRYVVGLCGSVCSSRWHMGYQTQDARVLVTLPGMNEHGTTLTSSLRCCQ